MSLKDLKEGYRSLASFRASYTATQASSALVASVAGKRVTVHYLVVSASSAADVGFLDGATAMGPRFYFGANAGMVLDTPFLETTASSALNVVTTGSQVTIWGWYSQE